jgi:hypothetical protein
MATYILLDSNGVMQNSFVWDGVVEHTVPDGYTVVQSDQFYEGEVYPYTPVETL